MHPHACLLAVSMTAEQTTSCSWVQLELTNDQQQCPLLVDRELLFSLLRSTRVCNIVVCSVDEEQMKYLNINNTTICKFFIIINIK